MTLMEEVEETREKIWRLALEEKRAPDPTAKHRRGGLLAKHRRNALRIVDAVQPGMKRRRRPHRKRNRQRLASHARRLRR